MPFRADDNALQARKEALEHALREIRDAQGQFDALKRIEAEREKELADVEKLLKSTTSKSRLPRRKDLRVAAPCKVTWESMKGDEHVRFCSSCEKNVYDLSSLTRQQAEALLRAKEGNLCVTYFKRADGTVLTADCPVGLRRRRLRNAVMAIAAAAAACAGATAAFGTHHHERAVDLRDTQVRSDAPIFPEKQIIVIIEPKGADVVIDGQTKMKADTGAITFAGTVDSKHNVQVSFGGRSRSESIVILAEDSHQYKVVLPPLAPKEEPPVVRVVGALPRSPQRTPQERPRNIKMSPSGAMD